MRKIMGKSLNSFIVFRVPICLHCSLHISLESSLGHCERQEEAWQSQFSRYMTQLLKERQGKTRLVFIESVYSNSSTFENNNLIKKRALQMQVVKITIVNDFNKLICRMSLRASAKQSYAIAASLALLAMTTLFCRLL